MSPRATPASAAAPTPAKPLKLAEIAARIHAHLKRFEADPKINAATPTRNGGLHPYYYAGAAAAGRYVRVTYLTFQGATALRPAAAARYLARLDAGGVGTHRDLARAAAAALEGFAPTAAGWRKARAAAVAACGTAEGVSVVRVGARLAGCGTQGDGEECLYGAGGTTCLRDDAHAGGVAWPVGAEIRRGDL